MAIVDVVKYNGGKNVFAWKYPNSELSTWTQLIVNESQEAILFKGGKAYDVFGPGRHTLSTANIPILAEFMKLPFGGQSPFTAEVWFVNKAYSLDIPWGTPSPIQLQDPKYSVFIPVRAFGQFGIQIVDSKQFVTKLVGTISVFSAENIISYFRGMYLTKVKDAISSYLIHKQISIMEINAYILEVSTFLRENISPDFEQFGIQLVSFNVNDISVPEDDPAVKQLKNALAKKAEMTIIGYDYQQERSFDTLENAASNRGSGGFIGAGMGMGMGMAMGAAVGNQFAGIGQQLNVNSPNVMNCPGCGSQSPQGKKFCPDCGYDMSRSVGGSSGNEFTCACCGSKNSRTKKFCAECGKKYNPCPKCGEDMPEGALSCKACGYAPSVPCPSCGKPLPSPSAKFCPECGYSIVKNN